MGKALELPGDPFLCSTTTKVGWGAQTGLGQESLRSGSTKVGTSTVSAGVEGQLLGHWEKATREGLRQPHHTKKVCLRGRDSLEFTVQQAGVGSTVLPLPLPHGSPLGIWPQAVTQPS